MAAMLGHPVPSAEAARKFLYQFHDEAEIEQAQRELPSGRVSYIPGESAPLRGLAQVNEDVMQELGRRCPEQKIATLDLAATLIESWKREASMWFWNAPPRVVTSLCAIPVRTAAFLFPADGSTARWRTTTFAASWPLPPIARFA
ncbi:MAG TPA: hypothetical protein VII95_11055 [Terriglobales bacterium]